MEGVDGSSARAGAARCVGVAAALLVLLQSPACAAGLARQSDRLVHPMGFAVVDPMKNAPGWSSFRVKGAALAYRGPGGVTMSWLVGCRRPVAEPRLLARHLLIGLHGRALTEEGAVSLDGGDAWLQRVSAHQGGAAVHMKTVTTVSGQCVLDWVLVGPGDLAAAEPVFDAWWGSFQAGSSGGVAP